MINIKINDSTIGASECIAGEVPVMLRSKICNLHNLSPDELVLAGEESIEKGGYFVCKGSEKVKIFEIYL